LFSTPTKPDYAPVGLDEIREVHTRVGLPVFCIGGIKLENLPDVFAAGARRAVIVSGILQAANVVDYCMKCRALLRNPAEEGTAK
jgi:thiamine-phosphate pyrophosphorylase